MVTLSKSRRPLDQANMNQTLMQVRCRQEALKSATVNDPHSQEAGTEHQVLVTST